MREPGTAGAPECGEGMAGLTSPGLEASGTLWLVRHGQSGWNVSGPVRVATAPPPSPGRPIARTLVENASITQWPPAGGPTR